jgi:hypothetical protein
LVLARGRMICNLLKPRNLSMHCLALRIRTFQHDLF